jgi:hypothetical protein
VILDRIRAACAGVAAQATHVHIDHEAAASYGRGLPLARIDSPVADPAHEGWGDDEATCCFVLTLDAVNFGSGYFPHLRKRSGMTGYFTIATALRERGPMPAEELVALTPATTAAIFGQDLDGPAGELMGLFTRALTDLGRFVLDEFGGRFTALVEAADHSAERLVEILDRLELFHDVAGYRGLEVPFYKRAQIASTDLALAFGGEGLGRFDDLDRLTMFADNLVPHVLRVDGVLRYEPELVERIEAGEPIPAGSEEEVEIRASAVHAVELIGEVLRRDGQPVTSAQLDLLLWNRGQEAPYKAIPRHRTRTVYY